MTLANSTALGLAQVARTIMAPAVGGFQNATTQPLAQPLEVDAKRGWLLQ